MSHTSQQTVTSVASIEGIYLLHETLYEHFMSHNFHSYTTWPLKKLWPSHVMDIE
jgi:hypothetical protein